MFDLVKISVIIPVYNTQKYLRECIDSILNQNFKDIEIICINDGSTDNSQDILDEYHKKDIRFKVFTQKNQGLAKSRNVGLNHAKGEYVIFLDSDDYLKSDSLLKLYNIANKKNLDFVMFKIMNFDYKTHVKSTARYFDMKFLKNVRNKVFNWRDVKENFFNISVTATSKLFKRELLEDIRFPEGIIFEDNLFFIKALLKAERIYFLEDYLYLRRMRPDSITNSYYGDFKDCIKIYALIIDYFKEINSYEEFSVLIFNRQTRDIYQRFKQLSEEYKKEYFDLMKKDFLERFEELKSLKVFNNADERSLKIYNNALNLNSYNEFDLTIQLYDLTLKNEKLKEKYLNLKDKYLELTVDKK